jgi:hypothetical protein
VLELQIITEAQLPEGAAQCISLFETDFMKWKVRSWTDEKITILHIAEASITQRRIEEPEETPLVRAPNVISKQRKAICQLCLVPGGSEYNPRCSHRNFNFI